MQTKKHIVLIDDDPLIRLVWEHQAKKRNILISCFESYEQYKESQLNPNECSYFVDYHLENELGSVVVNQLTSIGANHIHYSTGIDSEIDPKIPQIGKEFPTWL